MSGGDEAPPGLTPPEEVTPAAEEVTPPAEEVTPPEAEVMEPEVVEAEDVVKEATVEQQAETVRLPNFVISNQMVIPDPVKFRNG